MNIEIPSSATAEAFTRLGAVLERIPGFRPLEANRTGPGGPRPGGWLKFQINGEPYRLEFRVLPTGYPRGMQAVIRERELRPQGEQELTSPTVLVAPWFSPETVAFCAAAGYSTLDLSGNYRLQFGPIFLERVGAPPPPAQQRQAASIFAPKSARILRALLAVPEHDWKGSELSAVTEVSAGLVSRVRQHLLDQAWSEEIFGKVRLVAPEALLRAWATHQKPSPERLWRGYTLLHGQALKTAILRAMKTSNGGEHLIASHTSAAQWLAPYLRDHREHFDVTPTGFEVLRDELELESEALGENVVLHFVEEPEVFLDRVQPAPGLWTTSPAQTCLDLFAEGERGEEAAAHLGQQYLWPTGGAPPVLDSLLRERLQHLIGEIK